MSAPNTHDPDEEWAEERVRRMMEPEKPIEPPQPGEEIAPPVGTVADDVALPTAPEVDPSANPISDDGIDEIIHEPPALDEPVPTDPQTDKAVDEIMKSDGDDALKAQDKVAENAVIMHPNLWERFKNDFSDWWDDPRKRYVTIAIIVALLAAVFSFPASRSWALNTVGFRSTVSVKVVDSTTNLPLKNAQVSVAGVSGVSDAAGEVSLPHVRLGNQKLQVSKVAFAAVSSPIYVKSGTTKAPAVLLRGVGTQLVFTLNEYASNLPVTQAEVSAGVATAQSDKNGKAVLTVQPSDGQALDVHVAAKGYRSETVHITSPQTKPTAVHLVSATKIVFVSKQSGKYDLYNIDADGKNRKLLLAGTGIETQALGLTTNADSSKAALVSTRDNQRNTQGYLLSALNVVDVKTGASTTVEHAENITLLGWSGNKIVYQVTVAGASAANPNRQRIFSYDTATSKRLQLAATNYFNGTLLVNDTVYYATSATDPDAHTEFTKINSDNTGKLQLSTQPVWSVLRTAYGALSLESQGGWLAYTFGATTTKTGVAPSVYSSRQYIDSPDGKQSLWVDTRDGKGTLLVYDTKTSKDTTVVSQADLTRVIAWLDNGMAVYEKSSASETAYYVQSVRSVSSPAQKITDVTATSGVR